MEHIPLNRAERRRQKKFARRAGSASLRQAVDNLQKGQLNRAEKQFGRLLKSQPENPDALHYLGVTQYQQGRYDDSLASLSAAIAAAPDYAEAHNSLGIVLLEKRCLEEAEACFTRALKFRPDFAGAHANLGNAHQENGALDAAIDAYRMALSIDQQHREAAYRLASAYLAQGEPMLALRASTACLLIDQGCQHALAYLGLALQELGDEDEARILYGYDQRIHCADIAPPPQYERAGQFNEALATAVRDHPSLVWEPFNRVTRGGAVTGDLLLQPTGTITLFESVLRRALDAYRDSLVADPDHPFLCRIPKAYRLTLIASILKAGGRHPAHIHESAWLSGVYYVRVPKIVKGADSAHAGWLEFGRPDYPLAADSKVAMTARQPKAGMALFFPSYFFHGTIPFEGDEQRIGIAFDAYPEG